MFQCDWKKSFGWWFVPGQALETFYIENFGFLSLELETRQIPSWVQRNILLNFQFELLDAVAAELLDHLESEQTSIAA